MLIDGVPPQVKNIKSGLVRALAVTTRMRAAALPNVPTMIEQGLDYEMPYWTAIYAPAATPKPIIDKLAAEMAGVIRGPGHQGEAYPAGNRSRIRHAGGACGLAESRSGEVADRGGGGRSQVGLIDPGAVHLMPN